MAVTSGPAAVACTATIARATPALCPSASSAQDSTPHTHFLCACVDCSPAYSSAPASPRVHTISSITNQTKNKNVSVSVQAEGCVWATVHSKYPRAIVYHVGWGGKVLRCLLDTGCTFECVVDSNLSLDPNKVVSAQSKHILVKGLGGGSGQTSVVLDQPRP